jgi:hypothetical protein
VVSEGFYCLLGLYGASAEMTWPKVATWWSAQLTMVEYGGSDEHGGLGSARLVLDKAITAS